MGTKRNVVISLILSIVTCGFYAIYWHIMLTDEINAITEDKHATSGLMTLIFCIITCGFYALYWAYKMGEKVDLLKGNRGGSTGIMYLIIMLLGLGLLDYLLIQDTINKKVDGYL